MNEIERKTKNWWFTHHMTAFASLFPIEHLWVLCPSISNLCFLCVMGAGSSKLPDCFLLGLGAVPLWNSTCYLFPLIFHPSPVCWLLISALGLLLVIGGEGAGCPLHPMPPRCCLRLPIWQLGVTTWHNCVCDVTPCLPGHTRNVWLRTSQAQSLFMTNNYCLNNPLRIPSCLLVL